MPTLYIVDGENTGIAGLTERKEPRSTKSDAVKTPENIYKMWLRYSDKMYDDQNHIIAHYLPINEYQKNIPQALRHWLLKTKATRRYAMEAEHDLLRRQLEKM